MVAQPSYTVIGRLTSVYGVKGWLKVYSYTQDKMDILAYKPWLLQYQGEYKAFELEAGRKHGKGLIAKLVGIDDREAARDFCGLDIAIPREQLPDLAADEYYWNQLENLEVFTQAGECLGKVSYLIETGSNDVLVVKATAQSIDQRERLIPYLPDQVIEQVDLGAGKILVNWDSAF